MSETKNQKVINRPPVVVIMGHIDHGKSTLLDYIRNTDIVSKEAGSITQHLGAYEVEKLNNGVNKKITFIDTPGHEAFKSVRGRGVEVADVAILIVSAVDGVMPQTLEALQVIREKKLPFVVAINKTDLPTANIDGTKNSLVENEIFIEGYGGDIPCVEISASTGKNVDELLDLVLLAAELEEYTGDTSVSAVGFVIESHKDKFSGITTTLVIKNGTLKVGDFVISCDAYSPVRAIKDHNGKNIKEASFSTPVSISGWNKIPKVGFVFKTVDCKKNAEKDCSNFSFENNKDCEKVNYLNKKNEEFLVPLVIKADTDGSLEAILFEIQKIEKLTDENNARVKIVHTSTGNITENDMKIASSHENSIVVGFGVDIEKQAEIMAERLKIKAKTFKIIYELTDWLGDTIEENRPRIKVEEKRGMIKVLKTFNKVRNHQIIGGRVTEGVVKVNNKFKILRRGESVGFGIIKGLQQQKAISQEVSEGLEFGSSIDSRTEIFAGDEFEVFEVVEK